MGAGAALVGQLLSAAFPERNNPAVGAVEMKPEDYLSHLNDTIKANPDLYGTYGDAAPFDSVEEANQNGFNVPTKSRWITPGSASSISLGENTDNLGTDVTKYATDPSYGTTRPMQQPGFFTRAFNEAGARDAQNINNQYINAQPFATQEENVRKNIIGSRLANLPQTFNPAGLTTPQMISSGYTGEQTTPALNQMSIAAMNAAKGIPSVQSRTDLTQSLTGEEQASGAMTRTPVEEQILSANDMNKLQNVLKVDPATIELTAKQLQAELEREPRIEEVREAVLANQKKEANIQSIAIAQRFKDAGLMAGNEHLSSIEARRKLLYPETPSNPMSYTPGGQVVRTPGFVPTMQMIGAKIGTGATNGALNGQTINLGNGLHIIAVPPTDITNAIPTIGRPIRTR